MGKSKCQTTITLYTTLKFRDRVKRLSEKKEASMNRMIIDLVEKYLDKEESDNP